MKNNKADREHKAVFNLIRIFDDVMRETNQPINSFAFKDGKVFFVVGQIEYVVLDRCDDCDGRYCRYGIHGSYKLAS